MCLDIFQPLSERNTAESGEESQPSSDGRVQVPQRPDGHLISPQSILARCRNTAGVNQHESYHTTRKQNERNIRIFRIINQRQTRSHYINKYTQLLTLDQFDQLLD
ncbi:hypothetical protein AMECASPLE_038627 [Ameca splendens]|uniref:Uncharacterized protein n=1 Tax=Ameca splendens TaxID=208324 RepID=A0ABV0Z6W6_9TELE